MRCSGCTPVLWGGGEPPLPYYAVPSFVLLQPVLPPHCSAFSSFTLRPAEQRRSGSAPILWGTDCGAVTAFFHAPRRRSGSAPVLCGSKFHAVTACSYAALLGSATYGRSFLQVYAAGLPCILCFPSLGPAAGRLARGGSPAQCLGCHTFFAALYSTSLCSIAGRGSAV